MPVKFLKTGHTPSNKTQKYLVQLSARAYYYGKGDKEVSVLKPIIDKISITVPISDEDERTGYEQQIMSLSTDKEFPEFEPVSGKVLRYKYSMNWRHDKTSQAVLISAHPTSSEAVNFLRFEFNPDKLGAKGVQAFKDMLADTFAHPNLTYADVIKSASCTRLDVACDLINARTADLIATGQGTGKKIVYYSAKHDMETTYLDKPKTGSSKIRVYDKLQHQTDMDDAPSFEGVTHARVEIELGTKPLKTIKGKHNIFKRVHIIHPTEAPVGFEPWAWDLFLDSCRYRGVEAAIEGLPEDKRGQASEVLNKAATDTWRPLNLWKSWPDTVDKYGLLEP